MVRHLDDFDPFLFFIRDPRNFSSLTGYYSSLEYSMVLLDEIDLVSDVDNQIIKV